MTSYRGCELEKYFRIEGVEYRIGITQLGNVWFELIGGMTKKGSAYRNPCKDLFWDEPNFHDVDLGIDTLRVFNVVQKSIVEYVFTKKPVRIGFSASTDRKVRIYRWMAARLSKRLKNYTLVEYPTGVFNFYKQVQPAWITGEEQNHVLCP
jgi:hypothetical protein